MSDFDNSKSLDQIGSELIGFSKETETSIRGLVTELFPYIYTASKRMSTRAISKFLLESQHVKLSAATIAKALREPEKHLEAFADKVEPFARKVSDAWNLTILEVLNDLQSFEFTTQDNPEIALEGGEAENIDVALGECEEARSFISLIWYTQDIGLRCMTLPFIDQGEDKKAVPTSKDE